MALDDAGTSALIGWGGRTTSATSAAILNSSFIQGFELDDYHPRAPLHSNALVLPAMIAASPHAGKVPGSRFLLGAILGYETGPRVGQALGGLDMISRGWHSGVVFGTLSAAVSAGTLYSLDAARFEDALGMAATQSCGLMAAQFESMVKRMQHGFASRNGLTAAALAASGYVGIKRVFEREYGGYLAVFGEGTPPRRQQDLRGDRLTGRRRRAGGARSQYDGDRRAAVTPLRQDRDHFAQGAPAGAALGQRARPI